MLSAKYFDGRSSRPQAVTLSVLNHCLLVRGDELECLVSADEIALSERLGAAPRTLRLPDGSFCEIADPAALEPLLRQLGHTDSWVDRAQRSWAYAGVALLLFIASCAAAYVWGLPWAAQQTAQRLPSEVLEILSAQTLEFLDDHLLETSQLDLPRQRELQAGFDALIKPQGALPYRILFRAGGALGANALALPDGRIVLLDELVKLADNDEQIHAVLGHELGHVYHRHGLRMLVQSTLVGAVSTWWFGDTSALLVAAPTVLLNAQYSRQLESEADAYGAALLRANQLTTARLGEMLKKLMEAHGMGSSGKSGGQRRWLDYLASHPAPQERIQALMGPAVAHPPPSEAAP